MSENLNSFIPSEFAGISSWPQSATWDVKGEREPPRISTLSRSPGSSVICLVTPTTHKGRRRCPRQCRNSSNAPECITHSSIRIVIIRLAGGCTAEMIDAVAGLVAIILVVDGDRVFGQQGALVNRIAHFVVDAAGVGAGRRGNVTGGAGGAGNEQIGRGGCGGGGGGGCR